jgi:hypothetical protein
MMTGQVDSFPTAYYKVVVFFSLDWPIIRQVFQIKISGETQMVTYPCNMNQVNAIDSCPGMESVNCTGEGL